MVDFYYKFSTNETSTHLKCLLNIWLVDRLWPVIDAPAIFASHLFDLASVWNVARELLALSKQCMASRYFRQAPTFVPGDLVFLSSKFYVFTCVTIVFFHFALLIEFAWHWTSLDIIMDATFFLVAIVICFLKHPLTRMKYNWFYFWCHSGNLA